MKRFFLLCGASLLIAGGTFTAKADENPAEVTQENERSANYVSEVVIGSLSCSGSSYVFVATTVRDQTGRILEMYTPEVRRDHMSGLIAGSCGNLTWSVTGEMNDWNFSFDYKAGSCGGTWRGTIPGGGGGDL